MGPGPRVTFPITVAFGEMLTSLNSDLWVSNSLLDSPIALSLREWDKIRMLVTSSRLEHTHAHTQLQIGIVWPCRLCPGSKDLAGVSYYHNSGQPLQREHITTTSPVTRVPLGTQPWRGFPVLGAPLDPTVTQGGWSPLVRPTPGLCQGALPIFLNRSFGTQIG